MLCNRRGFITTDFFEDLVDALFEQLLHFLPVILGRILDHHFQGIAGGRDMFMEPARILISIPSNYIVSAVPEE